jgi:pyrroline-5-carboxylate reductase
MIKKKIGFIGAGKMGTALIEGLINQKVITKKQVLVYDVQPSQVKYFKSLGFQVQDNETQLSNNADIIFLAVKPNNISSVCEKIQNSLTSKHMIISIAAGITLKNLNKNLQKNTQIVRIMPNTPALINRGMSVYCYNKNLKKSNIPIIEKMFSAIGKVIHLEEKHFDAVTGLSGSGPAYVFLIINSLAEGGVKMGLTKKIALELAVQTVLGSAELVLKTGKHPEELKDMVTSPGGTTIEGLKVLETHKVSKALIEAVKAASEKSKKLAGD